MQQYYSHKEEFTKEPESYWVASTDNTNYPALENDITVDVAIVGGGMVGITSGYLLTKEGLKIAIVDADNIVNGTTAHTTAKITSQHDLIYNKMIKEIGKEKAKQYAQSNEDAIKLISKIIKEKNIDCDFKLQDAYVYTQDDNYIKDIKNEVTAAQELGIDAFFIDKLPLPFPIKGAVGFRKQAQFHPRKYLLSLAEHITENSGYIFENTKAVDIEELDNNDKYSVIMGNGKSITASKVIVASHYPFSNIKGMYFSRIYQERSYIVAVKSKSKFPDGMYISAETPTRSLRSQPYGDSELILIGGESHKVGHGNDINKSYKNLINFANENFDIDEILYRWSAQDCMTMDNIPYIGSINSKHPNIYIATGFKKWGMTSCTVSSMILKDLIIKGESPYSEVYDPSRFIYTESVWKYIKNNLHNAYMFISGKLFLGSFNDTVKKGEGKVIEVDGQKVGAYRSEEGKLYLVNTTCTHLGCEIKWNNAERTWDCPCHGSRFSPTGDVIDGPAFEPLEKIEIK